MKNRLFCGDKLAVLRGRDADGKGLFPRLEHNYFNDSLRAGDYTRSLEINLMDKPNI